MGYDMRIIETIETDKAKAAELRAVREDLWQKVTEQPHGTPESKAAFEAWDKADNEYQEVADPGYFRLNNSGMSVYWRVMFDLGMLCDIRCPVGRDEWPDYPENADNDSDLYRQWEARNLELCGRHGDGPMILPSFKFTSNDGWHVTPAEINGALEVYAKYQTDPNSVGDLKEDTLEILATDYWGKWINYLQRAAAHGGFRVR
jgi:hypothetical protein